MSHAIVPNSIADRCLTTLFLLSALRIRTLLYGEQDESVAAVLQYMGMLEFRAEEYDRALFLLNEFIRIREDNRTEHDGDFVNVLFTIGNINKVKGNEEEAQRCWKEAYKVFRELGLADHNPEIAEVMDELVNENEEREGDDDDGDGGMGGRTNSDRHLANDDDDGGFNTNSPGKFTKGVIGGLGKLTAKVKSTAGTIQRSKNRGQQL